MLTLQKFNNELFQLEVKAENGESLFDVESVARSLGITTTTTKNGKRYENVRWSRINSFLPQVAELKSGDFISEPMVYKLAFKANNEVAEKFQDWLAIEVLPSLRKNGMYATDELLDNPDLLIAAATKLKEERTLRLVAEQRVNELQPKADYYDSILKNKSLVTITVIAKNYGMSGQAMNEMLHKLGIQYKQSGTWLLYSKYQDKGYTHTELLPVQGSDNLKPSTKWTQKGHLFIYNLLKENDVLPIIEQQQLA